MSIRNKILTHKICVNLRNWRSKYSFDTVAPFLQIQFIAVLLHCSKL